MSPPRSGIGTDAVALNETHGMKTRGIPKMKNWPFLTVAQALILLRVVTPLLYMAHAAMRIANGSIPQFGKFMDSVGFPNGVAWVWAITLAELGAGIAVLLGWKVRWATLPLLAIAVGGIGLIHARNGWFVGEHGVGGSEYSIALIVMLLVLAAADRERASR
jgi:putative oxidoreductase